LLKEQNVNALAFSIGLSFNGKEDDARQLVRDACSKVASNLKKEEKKISNLQ